MTRMQRVPRRDQAVYDALSQQFRSGRVFAFSFDEGEWLTWRTEADWLATERNGRVRNPEARAAGCGPRVWTRDELADTLGLTEAKARRPGKAEYVDLVRRIVEGVNWTVDELSGLLEREAA